MSGYAQVQVIEVTPEGDDEPGVDDLLSPTPTIRLCTQQHHHQASTSPSPPSPRSTTTTTTTTTTRTSRRICEVVWGWAQSSMASNDPTVGLLVCALVALVGVVVGLLLGYVLFHVAPPTPVPRFTLPFENEQMFASNTTIIRDCDLNSLASILNSIDFRPLQSLPSNDPTEQFTTLFLDKLTPWITGTPEFELSVPTRPQPLALNCTNHKYENVLTGKPLEQPRFIIDIVPFGYDLDMLELRLLEAFEVVDVFLILESFLNHRGGSKPLYFQLVHNTPRFKPFLSKIIYFVPDAFTEDSVRAQLRFTRGWSLEKLQRNLPVQFMKQHSNHPLLAPAFAQPERTWVVQNDMDEIILGDALFQFKHCQTKPGVRYPLGFGAVSFKKSFEWLQTTRDGLCLSGANVPEAPQLKGFVWQQGPTVLTFNQVLEKGTTIRLKTLPDQCTTHMGVGSAVHLSSTAEPVAYWLKRSSVVEENLDHVFSPSFLAAGLAHSINVSQIVRETISPWCRRTNVMRYYQSIDEEGGGAVARTIEASWPWAVRENPKRFCFMRPQRGGALGVVADPNWVRVCDTSAVAW